MFKLLSKFLFNEEKSGFLKIKNPPPPPRRKSIREMSVKERKDFIKIMELERSMNPEIRAYDLNKEMMNNELKIAIINFLSKQNISLNTIYDDGKETLLEKIYKSVKVI